MILIATILVLIYQSYQMTQQTRQMNRQTKLSSASEFLSFNLGLMERDEDILFKVAKDDPCYAYVWKAGPSGKPESKTQQCGDAMLDVLSMAMASVQKLPTADSNSNRDDWCGWVYYVLHKSTKLRQRVIYKDDWWPEITATALDVDERTRRPDDMCQGTSPIKEWPRVHKDYIKPGHQRRGSPPPATSTPPP
ncbi:MAG: hypothetical protein ACJ74O_02775 [Frankiaceae bacterium]